MRTHIPTWLYTYTYSRVSSNQVRGLLYTNARLVHFGVAGKDFMPIYFSPMESHDLICGHYMTNVA